MRIMVSSKGTSGMRRGRAYSTSTGNPAEDKLIQQQQQQSVTPKVTPSRPKTAQPIAIPDSGKTRRNTSPRSNQSGSPRGYRSDISSSKSSPQQRASPSCGNFYAGAKFSEAPSAASLPKPPVHWTSSSSPVIHHKDQFQEISNQLKMLLNIKA